MTRNNNGIFLSQNGGGWIIRKGLRKGVGLTPARSRFKSLPPKLRAGSVRAPRMPGRNEPCPCGSGKKYKRCCGAG